MSIPVLIETYEETRRLAIAGSVVAPGDFRLKKLLPQLEQAGKKAAVFAKVADAVSQLIESDEKSSAEALLELTTLVNAILYTQGETGIEGELTPIQTVDIGRPTTQVPSRVMKPLQEALTSTGSGRLEIIRDAYHRGAFHDLRLIAPALTALDDTSSEIANFVAEAILPMYGKAILPELRATFHPKGRSGHVRRLRLMHQLDPEIAREAVQQALDEGSREVRVAAIGCLGDAPADLPFLLQQVKAKSIEVRRAALEALGRMDSENAAQVLCHAIEGADFPLAAEPIRTSRHPLVTSALLEAAEKQFDVITAGKERNNKKLGQQNERMCQLIDCLRGRDDETTEKLLLKMFACLAQLAAVRGEPGGKDVIEHLVAAMAVGPAAAQAALIEARDALPAECLGQAMFAACRTRKPAEVFQLFSPYLAAKINAKAKRRDPASARREAIAGVLVRSARIRHFADSSEIEQEAGDWTAQLDPRWLDLTIKLGDLQLVQALAVPGHADANAMLARHFRQRLGRAANEYDAVDILGTMIHVGHPEATDAMIEVIKRMAKSRGYIRYYWIGHLIPRLPKGEAVAKLEALLPELPENLADPLLDSMMELKSSS